MNLNAESSKKPPAYGPTQMFQMGKESNENLPDKRSLTDKKMSLNQYKPAYILEIPDKEYIAKGNGVSTK